MLKLTHLEKKYNYSTMRIFWVVTLSILSTFPAIAEKRPNILLIFADDIGYEALNSYGGLDFKTPSLRHAFQPRVYQPSLHAFTR